MRTVEAREEFRRTFAAMKEAAARLSEVIKELQAQVDADAETAACETMKSSGKKRGKKQPIEIIGRERYEVIAARYRDRADAAFKESRVEKKAYERKLGELAELAELKVEGEPRSIFESWTNTYASQGFGCESYARNDAEGRADILRASGFEPEIETDRWEPPLRSAGPFGVTTRVRRFRVTLPAAEDLDVEILRRLPPPPFKEQVRACLKRGGNPWVMNPFLPRDLLERLGLDWQGRDKPAQST